MIDIILDTLIDSLKLLPFLFIAFLIIELIEHKLNKQTKEIISGPEVLTRGFVYVRDSYELINEIKKISEDIIIKNTKSVKYIEYNKVKNIIRDELSKYLIKETGNKPMIITVMQEI